MRSSYANLTRYSHVCYTRHTFSLRAISITKIKYDSNLVLQDEFSHISHPEKASSWCTLSTTNRKNANCGILMKTWHVTRPLKLVDKICKYEIDPASTVEDTERGRFDLQTDGRTYGRTYGQTGGQSETRIPPSTPRWYEMYHVYFSFNPCTCDVCCVKVVYKNSHIRHSRAGRALLCWMQECGRLRVQLRSAVQAPIHSVACA